MEIYDTLLFVLVVFIFLYSGDLAYLLRIFLDFESKAAGFLQNKDQLEAKSETWLRRSFLFLAGSMIFNIFWELMLAMLTIGMLFLSLGLAGYGMHKKLERRYKQILRGE